VAVSPVRKNEPTKVEPVKTIEFAEPIQNEVKPKVLSEPIQNEVKPKVFAEPIQAMPKVETEHALVKQKID
jgi:hypothetical protein